MPPTMLLMGTALAMALFDANGAVLLFLFSAFAHVALEF